MLNIPGTLMFVRKLIRYNDFTEPGYVDFSVGSPTREVVSLPFGESFLLLNYSKFNLKYNLEILWLNKKLYLYTSNSLCNKLFVTHEEWTKERYHTEYDKFVSEGKMRKIWFECSSYHRLKS